MFYIIDNGFHSINVKYAGCQYFVFFYLNIEGWKVSAEQQLQAIELDFLKTGNSEKQVDYNILPFLFPL